MTNNKKIVMITENTIGCLGYLMAKKCCHDIDSEQDCPDCPFNLSGFGRNDIIKITIEALPKDPSKIDKEKLMQQLYNIKYIDGSDDEMKVSIDKLWKILRMGIMIFCVKKMVMCNVGWIVNCRGCVFCSLYGECNCICGLYLES